MDEKRNALSQPQAPTRVRIPAFAVCVLLAACAGTSNPVLYPNNHLKQVGTAAADRDTAECRQLASRYGVAETKDGKVAKQAAGGAAAGRHEFQRNVAGVQELCAEMPA